MKKRIIERKAVKGIDFSTQEDSYTTSADFMDCDFSDLAMDMMEFQSCTFTNCDFSGSDWDGVKFEDCVFRGGNYANIETYGATVKRTKFYVDEGSRTMREELGFIRILSLDGRTHIAPVKIPKNTLRIGALGRTYLKAKAVEYLGTRKITSKMGPWVYGDIIEDTEYKGNVVTEIGNLVVYLEEEDAQFSELPHIDDTKKLVKSTITKVTRPQREVIVKADPESSKKKRQDTIRGKNDSKKDFLYSNWEKLVRQWASESPDGTKRKNMDRNTVSKLVQHIKGEISAQS